MKFLTLIALVPSLLAYGGKPRKALPKTVPLEDYEQNYDSEFLRDTYAANPRVAVHEHVNIGEEETTFDDSFDTGKTIPGRSSGKLRKALPRFAPVDDYLDDSYELSPAKATDSFSRDRLASSFDANYDNVFDAHSDFEPNGDDGPTLKITVPLEDSRGYRHGAFPKQEIKYQMGTRVLTGDVPIYIIYYGSWTSKQKDLLNEFTDTVGDSSWWNIMRKYYSQESADSEKIYVHGKMSLAKAIDDNYSIGRNLKGDAIPRLINTHVENGVLPKDSNGIYLVLTSDDVQEELRLGGAKMCKDYCGYHLTGKFADESVFYYAMAGRPTKCILSCGGPNARSAPNGDPATEAMVSVIAHELAETVSDPDAEFLATRAWNDAKYMENGDMCSYKYGETLRVSEGGRSAFYNYVSSSGTKFLVQQNWDPELQKCVSSA